MQRPDLLRVWEKDSCPFLRVSRPPWCPRPVKEAPGAQGSTPLEGTRHLHLPTFWVTECSQWNFNIYKYMLGLACLAAVVRRATLSRIHVLEKLASRIGPCRHNLDHTHFHSVLNIRKLTCLKIFRLCHSDRCCPRCFPQLKKLPLLLA